MRGRPVLLSLLLATALALAGAHASAAAAAGVPPLRPEAPAAVAAMEQARALATSGALADAVRAAADLSALAPAAVVRPVLPARAAPAAPDRRARSLAASAPAVLQAPLADLLAAVAATGAAHRRALRVDAAAADGLVGEVEALLDAVRLGGFGAGDAAEQGRLQAAGAALAQRVDAAYDRAAVIAATWRLAAAIDAALPLLQAAASSPVSPPTVAGCDVVDRPPVLCVGGTGDNLLTADYALVVDLGGNDVHRHSAGGGDSDRGQAASVTIDLAGDDAYEAVVRGAGPRGVQGAGRNGVGILVDVAGNDRYTAVPAPDHYQVLAQGGGIVGAGLLADLGGDDRYAIRNTSVNDATTQSTAQGQGFTTLGAVAVLLDLGGGRDDYLAHVQPQPLVAGSLISVTQVRAEGHGYGAAGTGLHVDDGGRDTMAMRGGTAPVHPEEGRVVQAQPAISSTQLGGLGGVGVLLGGAGDADRSVQATASAPTSGNASAAGFGYGALGGFAGTSDAAGDDRYEVTAASLGHRRRVVRDGCLCTAADETLATSGSASSGGFGAGGLGGLGVLHDATGADQYELSAWSAVEARVWDRREEDLSRPATVRATGGDATVAGMGYGAIGAGHLLDEAGDDRYSALADTRAHAVSDTPADPSGVRSRAFPGLARALGQAVADAQGYGELRDLGGRDSYRTLADAFGYTDDNGVAGEGVEQALGQAAVQDGVALLVDEGGDLELFALHPARPPCTGTRGDLVWRDCGAGAGVGSNP